MNAAKEICSSHRHLSFGCVFTQSGASFVLLSMIDPPPLKWSDLRYVFDSQEGHDGKEALQG